MSDTENRIKKLTQYKLSCRKKKNREQIKEFILTNQVLNQRIIEINLKPKKDSKKLSKTITVAQELIKQELGLDPSNSMLRNIFLTIGAAQK
jgi:hypothetical protein